MNHLDVGITIIQIVVLFIGIFNPTLTRTIDRLVKIVSSLHALYEQKKELLDQERKDHKETKRKLKELEMHHQDCLVTNGMV